MAGIKKIRRSLAPPRHPYTAYEGTRLWRATRKALADLEDNRDLTVRTGHEYVVGYVCRQLERKRLVTREAVRRRRRASTPIRSNIVK